ncbi:MAG: tetratricopeptide repeat protein [bacterium]|nr:tetratricopeptide repeat protein [bacterium]
MANIDGINELIGSKDFKAAKKLIDEGLNTDQNNLELLKLSGLTEVNLENWSDAKRVFETVVKFSPEDATSWFYLGNCYDKLGDFISAKNSYIKVISLREEYLEAYKNLCVILLKLNELDMALEYASKATTYDSEDYLYEVIIGAAYMKKRDFESAIEPLKKALDKTIYKTGILSSLGTCYMATGKQQDAIDVYNQAIENSPNTAMPYYNLGSAYQIMQNHKKACEYFQKALDIEEDETFLSSLALSEVKLKDYECALKHYKQLSLMCPTKENYKYNIITCYEALGQYETAIKMLEELVYVNPKFIPPAQMLADLYIRTNQHTKAKEIFDNILLKNKITPELLHQYAILTSTLCDTETAEKILKKIIKMDPQMAKAHKDLGIIYLNKRLFDYAEEEFKTAMQLQPNDFEIIFEYGNFLYSISRNQDAERYYTEALELQPKNVIALTFMALNKLVMNQLDEAKDYIMKALEIEHHHEYIQFCAGRILYARGEYEEAKRYLIHAVEQNPDIETQNTLALTYYALKDYQQALNIFKNIDSKNPNSISVLMDIARCYEALKQNDNALEYLDKVVDIFPENEDAHEMIRRLS